MGSLVVDIALMPKIFEKLHIFCVTFDDFWDLWSPKMTAYPTPDALCLIILSLGLTINHVCTNEKFD